MQVNGKFAYGVSKCRDLAMKYNVSGPSLRATENAESLGLFAEAITMFDKHHSFHEAFEKWYERNNKT